MPSTVEKVNDTVVLSIQFEALDASTAKCYRQDFDQVAEENAQVLLDMENVEFVDSAGLGAIVAGLKSLRANGGEMKICNVHKTVRALFELVRMHRLVDIYNSREEALA